MKSLKTLVCVSSFALCFGAASMASAASFSPIGATFVTDAAGTIIVKSPSSFQQPVTCKAVFEGKVRPDGKADITKVTISPGSSALCNLPNITGLPWLLEATSTTAGKAHNVGYTITSFPPTNCGPSSIDVVLASTPTPFPSITLAANNQPLSGSCTVVTLNVSASGVTIIP
ncbi:alkane oxidation protein activator PraB [Pseudomonas gessardii]|uniref:alkane oxidation protein activator PraB n=1 Tax=Pseudomonas gessardii TaxID=78544 RepID=UPI0014726FE2|nr:alkane oxidation protein activator PraB [Pseudomonas gessardii]MBH3422761.1 protein activator of alkane oxidation PraB [Pseudomonas gessardii]NNA91530.1 protein activator of alkane oxidation PraB [Pseudomonas gessardii]